MGMFRKIADRITASFKKKPKPAPPPKPVPKPTPPPVPTPKPSLVKKIAAPFKRKKRAPAPKPTPKPLPSPAVAREMLFTKFQDQFWLHAKWNAPGMSRRINAMTDAQVYAALELSEAEVDRLVRVKPEDDPRWAAASDPNVNVLWYHGGDRNLV